MKITRFFAISLSCVFAMQLPGVAFAAYYTLAASEEDPPAACDIGDAVYAATCYGSYCDNTRLYCTDTNFPVSHRNWSSNFSEEGTNYRLCASNQIMTGESFSGRYGDNVSIECSSIPRTRTNCQWMGPYSEEQGYRYFGGKYANGMHCTGSYCDNRYYLVCNF